MVKIKKKIWPEYFKLVKSGKKKFELRLADFSQEKEIKKKGLYVIQF